jgi:DNA-binding Lrp family transcriptional regulator
MKKALDRIDYEILALLQNNARISNKEIAKKVGLAASTCLVRIRMLQSSGVVTGFHAEIDPGSLGVGIQAMIAVRLLRHFKPDVDAFRSHALSLPEVVQLYHVAGPIDFLAHVWAQNSDHLRDLAMTARDLAMTAFTSRKEVAHIETELIFEHIRSAEVPSFKASA